MVSSRRSANIIAAFSIPHSSSPAHTAFSPSTAHFLTASTVSTSTQRKCLLHLSPHQLEKPNIPSTRTRRNFLLSSSAFALAALSSPRLTSSFPLYPFSSLAAASVANTPSTNRKSLPSLYQAGPNSCESSTMAANEEISTGYLNAEDAAALDAELMSTPGFSLEQLMELAGLSVAEAVYQVAVTDRKEGVNDEAGRKKHVLLVCGPGNNGGDGLVAARHLVHFGLDATIVYPKPSSKTHFLNLIQQCKDMNIPILDEIPTQNSPHCDVIVDSIFGFSFRGTAPREPFATAIQQMVQLKQSPLPSSVSSSPDHPILISVDVPSGWDVDGGDLTGTGFHPDVLVSLTAPKLSAKKFRGRHFVGGRFLPPAIAEKYGIRMPPYPGMRHSMEISSTSKLPIKHDADNTNETVNAGRDDWAAQYEAYLIEKEESINKSQLDCEERDGVVEYTAKEDDWAVQYAKYCEEKERDFFDKYRSREG